MERKLVLKWLSIFSVSFFILSIVELLDLIIFSTVITMDLDGQLTIFYVIFLSGYMSIHAPLLWIFLLCVICAFIALALSIYKVAKKQIIENYNLAKFMLLIGLFFVTI
jgi:ABC-type antimicrobial peptide transport system permease subunit